MIGKIKNTTLRRIAVIASVVPMALIMVVAAIVQTMVHAWETCKEAWEIVRDDLIPTMKASWKHR